MTSLVLCTWINSLSTYNPMRRVVISGEAIFFVKNSPFQKRNFSNLFITRLSDRKTVQHAWAPGIKNIMWFKARILYMFNNWVYTTNHKRIAVNYFWFVVLSGTVGMVLATAIRLEFAYPGVGIFAGDSLQYLSVASAHGVIMVFFMIMPLLFGAFGNFLLPTQLGVHDVAFPRLNSAAFWFLPGGLLMLAQLVCVDRRFQRMNCFNMREIQAILKQRFFADLQEERSHHQLLDKTLIRLKLKLNGDMAHLPHEFISANYPLFKDESNRFIEVGGEQSSWRFFTGTYIHQIQGGVEDMISHILQGYFSKLQYLGGNLNGSYYNFYFNEFVSNLKYNLGEGLLSFKGVGFFFYAIRQKLYIFFDLISQTFLGGVRLDLGGGDWGLSRAPVQSEILENQKSVHLGGSSAEKFNLSWKHLWLEQGQESRGLRSQNPLFKYDYRGGDYLPKITRDTFEHLFPSIINVSGGLRPAAWFLSDNMYEKFMLTFSLWSEAANYGKGKNLFSYQAHAREFSHHYMFFNVLQRHHLTHFSLRYEWETFTTLGNKFSHMFLSSPMQHRIYANWRQLRFTREAWRCKLLATRHQKTLYRRYVDEDGTFWSIERNARDLIPGWAMITPFSSRPRFTAIGKVDIGLVGVFLVLNSSIVSGANFLVTYRYLSTLNNRKMRDARSFFAEGVMVASWMMIAANPMLVIGIVMLLADRHWQTSFFDYSGGGDTVLFQHMFWFFGHPEVYIIMIPVFGFVNTILSYYLRKRVSARASLMYSMYTISFLGFFVWGHHMYMVGLAHTTRMLFSTLTVMISVPAATKLMHWCVTIANSAFIVELPLLFTLTFIFFFISGGISGMCVAHTGMDVLFHDTFYVIGHFHVMLAGGAMFGSWAAFYFYFPAIFGVRYSRIYAYFHYSYYLMGQFMTVVPMFWLGYAGMPRRVLDYPASLGGWHSVISAGHLMSVAGVLSFFFMIFDSLRQARAAFRTSYGMNRFNIRLIFYFFEAARLRRHFNRNSYMPRLFRSSRGVRAVSSLTNWEPYETVLFSYAFARK